MADLFDTVSQSLCRVLFCLALASHVGFSQGQRERAALVVGNGAYEGDLLPNAGPDAAGVAAALTALDFEVIYAREISKTQFSEALDLFAAKLKTSRVGLFYFAGHAVQLRGHDYLLPIGTHITDISDLPREAIDVETIFAVLRGVELTTRLVRARRVPNQSISGRIHVWASRESRLGPGLAPPANAPPNTVIAFSTEPGKTASDGQGLNSPYTEALLHHIREPGLTLDDLFQRVRRDVTGDHSPQLPWENTSLQMPFYFRPPAWIEATISSGDDDVYLNVNGKQVSNWSADGNKAIRVDLKVGRNDFAVDVYNQHTTRGALGPAEGWHYAVRLAPQPSGASWRGGGSLGTRRRGRRTPKKPGITMESGSVWPRDLYLSIRSQLPYL